MTNEPLHSTVDLLPHERAIIELMVEDWLERYEPGSNEWADAQVIRTWLDDSGKDLARDWPNMPDLDGIDRFAEYPVAGADDGSP